MIEAEIKEALATKKIVLGSRQTKKALKKGQAKKVVIAKNCPEELKKDFAHLTKIAGIDLVQFEDTATRLGIICGKPFKIAALAILK